MQLLHSRDYLKLVSQLKTLKEGLEKNSDLTEVTQNISIEEIDRLLKDLTETRKTFVEDRIKSRKSQDSYISSFENGKKFISAKGRIIRGVLGIRDNRVMDFGYKPYKTMEAYKKSKQNDEEPGNGSNAEQN